MKEFVSSTFDLFQLIKYQSLFKVQKFLYTKYSKTLVHDMSIAKTIITLMPESLCILLSQLPRFPLAFDRKKPTGTINLHQIFLKPFCLIENNLGQSCIFQRFILLLDIDGLHNTAWTCDVGIGRLANSQLS